MTLAERIVEEVCKAESQLCIIGGYVDLTILTEEIEKILKESEMKKEKTTSVKPIKRTKTKWCIDKEWNVTGDGYYFNISDFKLSHYRAEADGTHTVTLVISGFVTGMLFGEDKKSAQSICKLLHGYKSQYYQAMRMDQKLNRNGIDRMMSLQEKIIKKCDGKK